MERDAAYFSRRAQEERDAARKAGNETARNIHLEMAQRYDELASTVGPRDSHQAWGTGAA